MACGITVVTGALMRGGGERGKRRVEIREVVFMDLSIYRSESVLVMNAHWLLICSGQCAAVFASTLFCIQYRLGRQLAMPVVD